MLGYLDFLFLSYSGRVGRLTYWVSLTVLAAVQFGVILLLLRLSQGSFAALTADPETVSYAVLTRVVMPVLIVGVLFLYPTYAITTKRWHDRGKSGWWSLIVLVPLIGELWALIELGFLDGDYGANEYGVR